MKAPAMDNAGPACYRVADLARRWACSPSTVRNRIADGQLRAIRIGGTMIRIPIAAVLEYEAACQTVQSETQNPASAASPAEKLGTSDTAAVASLRDARIAQRLLRL
jgi:excisionase family DNA binding protein